MGIQIRHKNRAYQQMLKSPEAQRIVRERAERIAAAAGDGYEAVQSPPRKRARAAVVTTSAASIRDNAQNNTIVRSLDAGR